jgi:serine/threonine protein phosphatase PrpC
VSQVQSFALSDRGLNERRPLNEDAFLADSTRGIFAVADGVGGAEAGEVASQTAIEVLDEAFRHLVDGADVEDLMELAIQRANASIHQMAQEHPRFSMMATTIVALHIRNGVATVGHVGDSRLYCLTPEGSLVRQTEDHSVVEEEVRAGRMTREQAANHPSKNVISRALGAEDSVEVDMKIMEVEEGTEFLLCSDGITRHVSDGEMRQLLVTTDDLAGICQELKERCYERGAEDNLTVVVVRVGNRIAREARFDEVEPTITPVTEPSAPAANAEAQHAAEVSEPRHILVPASRAAFPGNPADAAEPVMAHPELNPGERALRISETRQSWSSVARVLGLIVLVAAVGGAFYAGTRYKGQLPFTRSTSAPPPEIMTAVPTVEDPILKFEHLRREIDRAPNEWLTGDMQKQLAAQGIQQPLDSASPEFLYLYGRASLLSGNVEEAGRAFEAAIIKADLDTTGASATIRKEATLGLAALTVRSDKDRLNALKRYDEMMSKPAPSSSP